MTFVAFGYGKSEDPEIIIDEVAATLKKDVYLNGQHYDNWMLKNPILEMKGSTYVAVDKDGNALIELCDEAKEFASYNVSSGYKVTINGKSASSQDVLVLEDGTEYYSLRFLKKLGRIDAEYSSISGIYLSTQTTSAAWYLENNNNSSYIVGRCKYMQRYNKKLTMSEALEIEYLIRHAAKVNNIDADMFTAVVRLESGFNPTIGTRTVGLTQIMLKYAAPLTYEDLIDPHTNLDYGAAVLAAAIKKFGNIKTGLCAYNKGTYAVLAAIKNGTLNTSYADKVYSYENLMHSLIKKEGYSVVFTECIGQ